MSTDINKILATIDTNTFVKRILDYELSIERHVPDHELRTVDGELNLRNPYGAILYHAKSLRSVLSNFNFHGGN